MRTRVIVCLLFLALLMPAAIAQEPYQLSDMPEPYAQTALALDANLREQFEIIARAERAAQALELAQKLHAGAEEAQVKASLEADQATAAANAAEAAVAEQQALTDQLAEMRALYGALGGAQAAFELAQTKMSEADAALDKATKALDSANSQHKKSSETLSTKKESLLDMQAHIDELRAKAESSADVEDADTLAADLLAAEDALAVLEQQVERNEAEVLRLADQVPLAEKAKSAAEASQSQAVIALEMATLALEAAKDELETVELTTEQLDAADALSKLTMMQLETELAQAQALLQSTQSTLEDRDGRLAEAASALAAATTENEEADAAMTALCARWEIYAEIPGAVLEEGFMPAMDLVASEDVETPVYVVHSAGTNLYFFENGNLIATEPRRGRDMSVDVSLTTSQSGDVALRYVHADGTTQLERFAPNAAVLFTGEYAILRLSDMLGPIAVYLGCACQANTLDIPGVLTVVQPAQDEPLRHWSNRWTIAEVAVDEVEEEAAEDEIEEEVSEDEAAEEVAEDEAAEDAVDGEAPEEESDGEAVKP